MTNKLIAVTVACALLFIGCKNDSPKKSKKSPVIGTIEGVDITAQEFDYVYSKNNSKNEDAYSDASIKEYLDLYTNFKLKVREAEALGYDTTDEFKNEFKDYERQLAEPYLTEKSVSEQLVKEAYKRSTMEVNASHILITVKPEDSPKDTSMAYNKILKYREMVTKGGADFADIAKKFSQDPSAKQNGGNLGYFSGLQMVYPFENAAFNTAVGSVSKPVRTRFGYHIVKVHDKRAARGQVKVAHIMRRATEGMDEIDVKAAEAKINEIHKKISDDEDWNSLCKQFSEDGSSAAKGGDLKWFGAGQMPKEFDEASFGLVNKGDISAPIKTAYGYHIIKLIDKKGIPTFEEMKPELESKISRDERSQLPKEAFIKRIKKENNLEENASVKAMVFLLADSTFTTPSWSFDEKNSDYQKSLFTINSTNKYSALDFLSQIKKNLRPKNGNPVAAMNTLYNSYLEKELVDYEKANLSNKYIDYKMLLKEYRDGILLFKLMDEKVWSKAVQDTAGLKSFHANNNAKYMWKERANATILNASSDDVLKSVLKDMTIGLYATKKYKITPLQFVKKEVILKDKTQPLLDKIVGYMNGNKNLSLVIKGYTDSYGKEKSNMDVSLKRVDFVQGYLISKGIEKDRLTLKAFGESNPISLKTDKGGVDKNNRVEFEFLTSNIKALEEKYNVDNSLTLTVTQGLFEKGDNAILDEADWKVGEYKIEKDKRSLLIKISEIKSPTQKKLNECKGLVISDYQNQLEKDWIKSLKVKYPVVINQPEVDKLIKK